MLVINNAMRRVFFKTSLKIICFFFVSYIYFINKTSDQTYLMETLLYFILISDVMCSSLRNYKGYCEYNTSLHRINNIDDDIEETMTK